MIRDRLQGLRGQILGTGKLPIQVPQEEILLLMDVEEATIDYSFLGMTSGVVHVSEGGEISKTDVSGIYAFDFKEVSAQRDMEAPFNPSGHLILKFSWKPKWTTLFGVPVKYHPYGPRDKGDLLVLYDEASFTDARFQIMD